MAGAPTLSIRVTNPSRRGDDTVTLHPGDGFPFGREVGGVGRISDDPRVSRHHGVVHAASDGLSVSSTSRSNGFVVRDRATPSRLYIPCGVGPVAIPFRQCSIVLEHCVGVVPYLDITVTGSASADAWHQGWGPDTRAAWRRSGASTAPPIGRFDPELRNGRPYAWFKTLVALCEPHFGLGPAGTPTNPELAARLHVSTTTVEKHLTEIYRALEIDRAAGQRELAVTIAITTGAVTPHDLTLLR